VVYLTDQREQRRPKIFIGSSVEGLDVARAVQYNLDYDAEVILWNQGVFQPSGYVIEDLLETANRCDFAVFIFTPDDTVRLRQQEYVAVRDNVVLEFGLFLGVLGRRRTFYIVPQEVDNFHLASDLLGVNPVKYNHRHEDLIAGTGAASTEIRRKLQREGLRY
jgi:predicted nucleotide-binding protein